MSGGGNLLPINKLKGVEDYNDWKFAMQSYLEHEDLWKCVIGDAEAVRDAKNMAKAKAKLVLAVDKCNYTHIRAAATPNQLWDNLKSAFEDSGLIRKVGLLKKLVTTRLESCDNTEDYIDQICTTAKKLDGLDFTVE